MIERDGTFACHKTVFYNDDHSEGLQTQDTQHCAGALIVLMKIEMPNQLMRIAGRLRVFDAEKLAMDAPVFDTIEDFIDAQQL